MSNRWLRRSLAALATLAIAVALLLVWRSTASAHEVTGITATCESVTVQFTGFPPAGVAVRIVATVQGHATLSKDVVVKDTTSQATLDISSATNTLFGATATVEVDVTW